MSRNFELLSQLETEIPFDSVGIKDMPATAKPADPIRRNRMSQEFITLAQTIFLSGNANTPHHVVLCGVDGENGSSEICIHLGRALAKSSARPVCLIDANLQFARLENVLVAGRQIPLPDMDEDLCRSVEPDLWIAELGTPGKQKDAVLPAVQQITERLTALRTRFDFILMDAPGVNAGGDASVLSQLADGAILVIEANSTRKASALKAKQSLETANARILGSVLNNRTFPIPERLYWKL